MANPKSMKRIPCTYDDCPRLFHSEEAMKRHKAKDGIHDYYCKRCDYDAPDDVWLLYHQIDSLKHICCPVCGREFKSEGGRDRHVDMEHTAKQNLICAGCKNSFTSASGLMAHIERDKCDVIKKVHFYRHRAERQITKDAWQIAQDPTAGSTVRSVLSDNRIADIDPTLLDDESAWVETDWAGNPVNELDGEYEDSDPDHFAGEISALSMDNFPPLNPGAHSERLKTDHQQDVTKDLLDFEPTDSAPGRPEKVAESYECRDLRAVRTTVVSSLDRIGDTHTSYGGAKDDRGSVVTAQTSTTFQTARADGSNSAILRDLQTNTNSNAHIKIASRITLPSHLEIDKYWDPNSETYACPGRKCGQGFPSIEKFKAHLLSGKHVDTVVKCPGCFRRFKNTAALVAHCESASRKCNIRHALDYDLVIRHITAGMIAADGYQEDASIKYTAQEIENW